MRPRNIACDRFFLLTRRQAKRESMEQFHLALGELAEHCKLNALEDSHFHFKHEQSHNTEGVIERYTGSDGRTRQSNVLRNGKKQAQIRGEDKSMIRIVGRTEPVLNFGGRQHRRNR